MEGVAATSLLTAAARALESERSDGLLVDPFARGLAGDQGMALLDRAASGPRATNGSHIYVVRHRFFDDWLMQLSASTGIRQVVLVASGLDTRAYRLDWPAGIRVFEIDQPQVFAHKNGVLASAGAIPTCDRRVVTADLRDDWPDALVDGGFEPGRPSAWVAEGLIFYLPESAALGLLDEITRLAAPGSYLAMDVMSTSPGPPQEFRDLFASLGAPFLFTTDAPAQLLGDDRWDTEVVSVIDVARRVGVELSSGGNVVIAHRTSG